MQETKDNYIEELKEKEKLASLIDSRVKDLKLSYLDDFNKVSHKNIRQGHGSKLDSDLLDGYEASQFITLANSSSQALFNDGSASVPSISFTSDKDTGFFWNSTGDVRFTSNGTLRFIMNNEGISSTEGSASLPGYSFLGAGGTATGMYQNATNDLGFTTDGVLRFHIDTSNLISLLPFLAPDGSVSAPSISLSSDT